MKQGGPTTRRQAVKVRRRGPRWACKQVVAGAQWPSGPGPATARVHVQVAGAGGPHCCQGAKAQRAEGLVVWPMVVARGRGGGAGAGTPVHPDTKAAGHPLCRGCEIALAHPCRYSRGVISCSRSAVGHHLAGTRCTMHARQSTSRVAMRPRPARGAGPAMPHALLLLRGGGGEGASPSPLRASTRRCYRCLPP